jgi:hypothetical protein
MNRWKYLAGMFTWAVTAILAAQVPGAPESRRALHLTIILGSIVLCLYIGWLARRKP